MTFEAIVEKFKGHYNSARTSAKAICPCHADKQASLCISQKDGKTLIYCQAGCETEKILEHMGMTWKDLYEDEPTALHKPKKDWREWIVKWMQSKLDSNAVKETLQLVDSYDYTDENKNYLYTRCRLEYQKVDGEREKVFRYVIVDKHSGKAKLGLNDTKKVLYRLPEIVSAAKKDLRIYLVEGEKDVKTLRKHGLLATTAGSTNDWRKEFAEYFRNRDVAILGDNDGAGRKLVEQETRDLLPVAKSVKALFPSKLAKGDVTDFFTKEGGTLEQLKQIVDAASTIEKDPELSLQETRICATEDEVDALPILKTNRDGKNLNVLENYVEILTKDRIFKNKIRYNILDGREELTGMPWDLLRHPVRDLDTCLIRLHISDRYGISSTGNISQAVTIVASQNSYHPVVQLLDTLKWDGTPRIGDLFPRYLGAERTPYTEAVTKLLLEGAIQRVRNPGVKFDYAIILADTRQGTGKSSICKLLALDNSYFTDALGNMADTKTAHESFRGRWIVEMGELIATRNAKDIETIKAFLSRTVDTYRESYGHFPESYPRQAVFIGTTNRPQFLPSDNSGNRRFLPIICDGSKAEKHPLEDEQETREFIRQCYAEAIHYGETQGWQLVLDPKYNDELEEIRAASTPENSKIGIIQEWLDTHGEVNIVCTKMVWDECLRPEGYLGSPQQYELQDIAEIMNLRIVGWERYTGKDGRARNPIYRFNKYGSQRAWQRTCSETLQQGVEKLFT